MSESVNGLSELQQLERDALTGDRGAIIRVVSGLREYRAAVADALRLGTGGIDSYCASRLADAVAEIESVYGAEDE